MLKVFVSLIVSVICIAMLLKEDTTEQDIKKSVDTTLSLTIKNYESHTLQNDIDYRLFREQKQQKKSKPSQPVKKSKPKVVAKKTETIPQYEKLKLQGLLHLNDGIYATVSYKGKRYVVQERDNVEGHVVKAIHKNSITVVYQNQKYEISK